MVPDAIKDKDPETDGTIVRVAASALFIFTKGARLLAFFQSIVCLLAAFTHFLHCKFLRDLPGPLSPQGLFILSLALPPDFRAIKSREDKSQGEGCQRIILRLASSESQEPI